MSVSGVDPEVFFFFFSFLLFTFAACTLILLFFFFFYFLLCYLVDFPTSERTCNIQHEQSWILQFSCRSQSMDNDTPSAYPKWKHVIKLGENPRTVISQHPCNAQHFRALWQALQAGLFPLTTRSTHRSGLLLHMWWDSPGYSWRSQLERLEKLTVWLEAGLQSLCQKSNNQYVTTYYSLS